jgi:hypothetical protein
LEPSAQLNNNLRNAVKEVQCHLGYALTDSVCALGEGVATFLSAAISDKMFNLQDKANIKFKHNAHIYIQPSNDFGQENVKFKLNLETGKLDNMRSLNIVGPQTIDISDKRQHIFYRYSPTYEEASIASVLWDLYDQVGVRNPANLNDDKISIDLAKLLSAVLLADFVLGFGITVNDAYGSIVDPNKNLINQANKIEFDKIFANFGICIDGNDDGKCTNDEVKNGRSAWKARFLGNGQNIVFEYAKNPGRP